MCFVYSVERVRRRKFWESENFPACQLLFNMVILSQCDIYQSHTLIFVFFLSASITFVKQPILDSFSLRRLTNTMFFVYSVERVKNFWGKWELSYLSIAFQNDQTLLPRHLSTSNLDIHLPLLNIYNFC